jgi:FAD/FMN-containing dehydrogenase
MDAAEGVIELEAGVVLDTADAACRRHGFEIPLDLAAKGSCQVGLSGGLKEKDSKHRIK